MKFNLKLFHDALECCLIRKISESLQMEKKVFICTSYIQLVYVAISIHIFVHEIVLNFTFASVLACCMESRHSCSWPAQHMEQATVMMIFFPFGSKLQFYCLKKYLEMWVLSGYICCICWIGGTSSQSTEFFWLLTLIHWFIKYLTLINQWCNCGQPSFLLPVALVVFLYR